MAPYKYLCIHAKCVPILLNRVCQAPLSMAFSRQEYWNGLPFPPPGDLADPGIKPPFPASPACQVNTFPQRHVGSPNIC